MSTLSCGHGIYSVEINCLTCCRFVIDTLNGELGKVRSELSILQESVNERIAQAYERCAKEAREYGRIRLPATFEQWATAARKEKG